MWKIPGNAPALAIVLCLLPALPAAAEGLFINQNQTGLNLPGVTLPQGHDEIRAADGTTCRSAVGGNGAYFDVGVIGNRQTSATDAGATGYGRLVIPLGTPAGRVDCRTLYNLEIERLRAEIEVLKMGGNRLDQSGGDSENWLTSGWKGATVVSKK